MRTVRLAPVFGALPLVALLSVACGGGAPAPATPTDPDPILSEDEPAPSSSPEVQKAIESIRAEDFEGAKSVLLPASEGSDDAEVFYYLGVAQANTGEVEPAVESLRKALSLDPKLTDASLNLAAFLIDLGRTEEALSAVDAGLEHAPDEPSLLENKALALLLSGKAPEASKVYAQVIEMNPSNEELRFTYAQALAGAGDPTAASAQLEKLADSKDIAVLNSAADMFGRLKQFERCVTFATRAIGLSEQSELYVRRGLCKGGSKDGPGAIADFKKAVELDGNSAAAHFYLGKALGNQDKAGARSHFNSVIQLSGDKNPKLKAAAEKALADL